ncbi:RagB/SusD family nutrient uptake outer membrane protein [Marnyiella aurantia]|uniref:RagB/SusD family nutrient uptake outer membrane protein n=1 Tax=Marnyiella aurantia TaxID=2758037 RepID=A0A7D7LSG7_9FLAO|nr:RagB/SusD family nutrient uptake outer membrane protein [Marnyiella aurantia]MBA5246840.1 RagB/SusD family nutrient uptake outer membrane protein [Marnyiella aurantia]QMS97815.1 RagB/SusD family nutrient uptake outer membrane protein [Marnyiella aurantia]
MNKIKLLVLCSASLFFTNCSNLMDDNLDPDGVIEENVFKTVKNAEKVVLGAYSAIPTSANIYAQALLTDELKFGAQNNGQGKEVHSWTFTSGQAEFSGVWYGAYGSISNANKFLLNFDNVATSTPAEVALKNQLRGEALALRAFNHFILVRSYSPKYSPSALGIPYVTSDDIFAQPSRPTMQETYQAIMDDAAAAYPLLPVTTADNKFRFNQGALRAMQAYIALEMGDFDSAINYANQALAINSALASTLGTVQAMWTDANRDELYMYQANLPGSASAAPGALFTTTALASGGLIYWHPSVTLYSKFAPADFRRTRYFGGTPANLGSFIVNKYPGTAGNYGINNVKLFRVADMHLVKAEAYARKAAPDLAASFASYQLVRVARNAGTSAPFTSATDAVDKILEERWKEFAWEGSRLFDLKRNGRTITRVGADIYILNPVPSLTDINRYTYPIPTAEVQANPNMQQNPGY